MLKCPKCKMTYEITYFMKNGKQLKTCSICREKTKQWKNENKARISDYNKLKNIKKNSEKEFRTILLRKKSSDDEYQKFFSLKECYDKLGLCKPNLSKMLKGELKSTGGYEGKYGEMETIEIENIKSWEIIKEEKNYNKKIISSKRVLHEEIEGIKGKKCCNCKEWKPLLNYNYAKNHWDKLRNDCKECLTKYRKENRKQISKHYCEYEKKRKQIDPEFKLSKTLRSRLGNAIKRKNAIKLESTFELTGCSINFLKGFLEAKFLEGMSWENHGEWHIDHIKPCCQFNLHNIEEQRKCFHYSNLQPLWKFDNLVKGGK